VVDLYLEGTERLSGWLSILFVTYQIVTYETFRKMSKRESLIIILSETMSLIKLIVCSPLHGVLRKNEALRN